MSLRTSQLAGIVRFGTLSNIFHHQQLSNLSQCIQSIYRHYELFDFSFIEIQPCHIYFFLILSLLCYKHHLMHFLHFLEGLFLYHYFLLIYKEAITFNLIFILSTFHFTSK